MAYDFNGTNQRLSTASAPATATPLTLACWFYSNNITTAGVLMVVNSSADNSRYRLEVRGDVAGDPVRSLVSDQVGNFASCDTTSGYSAATWSHAASVYTSNTSRTVYLNGGSSATNTTSIAPLAGTLNRLTIGSQQFGGTINLFFAGRIAEAGVWNAALTDAEIASLADGMTCDKVRPQSLVFYAPLVRDLIDAKGGLTITNNNTATVANHPRVYA